MASAVTLRCLLLTRDIERTVSPTPPVSGASSGDNGSQWKLRNAAQPAGEKHRFAGGHHDNEGSPAILILTRHLEEAVRIGAGVVRVVGITGPVVKHAPDCTCQCPTRNPRRVALGFEFPDDVEILREELLVTPERHR